MKTITEKAATLIFTALCMALIYMGFTMMTEVGVGYIWLAMYTIAMHIAVKMRVAAFSVIVFISFSLVASAV